MQNFLQFLLLKLTATISADFPSNCFPDFKHYKSLCLLHQQSICEVLDKVCVNLFVHPSVCVSIGNGPQTLYEIKKNNKGCLKKKRNLFDLEYLRDALIKSIVLLVCYSLLPYNSIKPNFSFL